MLSADILKKAVRGMTAGLISLSVLLTVVFGAVADRLPEEDVKVSDTQTAAPLPEPADDIILPNENRLLGCENEYPTALDVYDGIFSAEEAPTVSGELKIISTDLSRNPSSGTVYVKNNTDYSITPSDYLSADSLTIASSASPTENDANPLVLIYHTHGTEGYAEDGKGSYASNNLPRSRDITENVVAVGAVLANSLIENGVPTIHCETMHDAVYGYNNSYTASRKAVAEYLERYPSIKYVFDVHRDALVNSKSVYKVLTYDESTPAAQIMLVVGTDSAGALHPNWRENLSFAVNAQYLLTKRLENLMRPICIKRSSFNQQLCTGALLIEIGTCANTLAEAKNSAEILGETLAALIRSIS